MSTVKFYFLTLSLLCTTFNCKSKRIKKFDLKLHSGLWVELPLLVQKLPESWDLPSYLSVVVQLANIGPLSYTLLNNYFPKHVTEVRAIYFVMSLGLVSTILLSIFWEKTTFVAGANHSTALLGDYSQYKYYDQT